MSGNEVSGKKRTSLSASQICSSDENFDLFCIPCADNNKHVEARGFCTNCQDFLCRDCVDFHKTFRATKNHVIQNEASMPRDAKQVHPVQQPKDVCTELCAKHHGKVLEYYCASHDEFACSVCVTLGHITCGVGYIPEMSKGVVNSAEYKQLSVKINDLHKKFEETKENSKEPITAVENKSEAYTDEVTQLGEDLIKHIKDLMQRAVDEKEAFVKEMIVGLRDSQDRSKQMIEEISSMKVNLGTKSDSENQSFVLMKKLQKKVKAVEDALGEVQIGTKPTVFKFDEHPCIQNIKETETLGTLFRYKKIIKQYEDIDITTQGDEGTPQITGLEVLSDGRIAMADNENKSVKLFDTKDNNVTEIKLQHKPWSVAEVSKGQLAVTLPSQSKIQFLSVAHSLTLGRVINTDVGCVGITACQDKLIVCFITTDDSSVQILDMNGRVLRRINKDQNGQELFSSPWCVAVNPNNKMIYVSDLKTETLTCMSLEGEVKAVYNLNMGQLGDLIIGEQDSVYICSRSGVQHITGEGTRVQRLLDPGQDGGVSQSVAHDTNTGRLYLGRPSTSVRVYQLQ